MKLTEYEQYLIDKFLKTNKPSVVADDSAIGHISYERIGSK